MLNVSSNVSSYLGTNSVQMLPHVSGEWNYNLVYQPYATFAGNGNMVNVSATNVLSTWQVSGKGSIQSSGLGKVTTVFTNPSALEFLVTPTANSSNPTIVDMSDPTNFQSAITTAINLPTAVNKCYKIVFLAKSIDNNVINLVAQSNNQGIPLTGTASKTIDNIDWQVVELKVGQRATDPSFSSINLTLDITNTTLSSSSLGSSWGILINQIRIYEITYFDYLYGNLWDTNIVFSWFRPGESYVRSGNSSVADADVYAERLLKNTSSGGIIPSGWNTQAPCSPVVYSPRILFSSGPNPIFKNGAISPFSQYKYFVSELPSGSTSIGAAYEELLSVNKLVLKFNISQSIPDNITVKLYNSVSNTTTSFTVPGTSISKAGVCVLYWQGAGNGINGSGWDVTKWNWTPSQTTSGMPFIDANGNISMHVGGVNVNGYQNIDTISVTQLSSTPLANFTTQLASGNITPDAYSELHRMQVIEISPRLELDLSSFILDFEVKKELDNQGTPLPISSISANSGIVSFSNIPLTGNNNAPLSVFSTNANAFVSMRSGNTITSPLAGLLVKNVKLYLNYYFPTQSNAVVPAGVHYVDTWDNQDIKQTKANTFDIMKFLQTLPVNDYVSESQSIDKVFSSIMDFAGFTDYNYDELITALNDAGQKITVSYFYADAANKTVYQALQEAFLAYQIGAFIDEYGVMRFKNLNTILSTTSSVATIVDQNIIVDTYNENIKTKVGKILMRYRGPQQKRAVNVAPPGAKASAVTSILQVSPDIIWQQDTEDLVPFNFLKQSMTNLSQNYYVVDQGSFNNIFLTTTLDHAGYCFVENEIMSTGNMEIALSQLDSNGNITGVPTLIYPSNSNELNALVGSYSNQSGLATITQTPSGKFMGVQRGLFGTKASTHNVMLNASDYTAKLSTLSLPLGTNYASASTTPAITQNIIRVPTGPGSRTMVMAGGTTLSGLDNGYATYSAKFRFPQIAEDCYAGLFFGLSGQSTSSQTYFVEIHASLVSPVKTKFYLNFYYIDSTGQPTSLLNVPKGIDITDLVEYDFANEPIDDLYQANAGGFINLKFVRAGNGQTAIYVNKNRILLDRRFQTKNAKGNFIYSSYWAGANSSTDGSASTLFANKNFRGTNFGFFATASKASTTVDLSEIYATETPIDEPVNYYFQTRQFLNGIVAGYNITERSFFVQSRPQIYGLNYYDIQLALTPSLGAEMFKASYVFPYYPNNDTSGQSQVVHVRDNALAYSDVYSTGFRAKFAIANASNYSVYTKTTPGYTQLADAEILLSSRGAVVLTPQQTLERIINPQLVNEVVELQSDWVQSKDSADSILKVLAYSSDSFSKDIIINIFGDPRIQIGDVITLSYSLKNLSNVVFFVQGVDQVWSDGGLVTTLTLNQISYGGTNRNSLPNSYPSSTAALANAPKVTGVTPSTGYDTGGTTVTITGSNFGTDSVAFFGSNQATSTTYVSSTQLTAVTPPSSIDGAVDVSVLTNGIVGIDPASNNPFTYNVLKYPVKSVTGISASVSLSGSFGGQYPVAITWTLDSVNTNQYNAYNLIIDDGVSPVEYDSVSDTGSTHTYTTANTWYGGTSLTITVTPLYIDPTSGITFKGTANTVTYIVSSSGVVNPPVYVSRNTIAISQFDGSGTSYQTFFNIQNGSGANATYVFLDGTAGSNRVNPISTGVNYFSNVNNIGPINTSDTGNHTVYLYGYNTGSQSESSSSTLDPNAGTPGIVFNPSQEVGKGVITNPNAVTTTPQAPNFTTGKRITTSSAGGSLIVTSVAIAPGANSDSFYLYLDSPTGAGASKIAGPGTNGLWAGTQIQFQLPIKSNDTACHTLYALGHNSNSNTNGTVTAVLTYNPSQEASQGGYFTGNNASCALPGGGSGSPTPSAPPLPSITPSVTGAIDFTWSVTSFSYDTYYVTYTDGTTTITDTISQTGPNWVSAKDGTTISTDGLYFYDSRYEQSFAPSTNVTFTVYGSKAGQNGTKATASGKTPAVAISLPYAPLIFVTGSGSTKIFNWTDDYMPTGTLAYYAVWLYYASNDLGTPVTISGTAHGSNTTKSVYLPYASSPTNLSAYYMPENPAGYQISTTHGSPILIEARAIFQYNGNYYAGPLGSLQY